MNVLMSKIKKLYIIFFTSNPYKIRSFKKLYPLKKGLSIDQPESTTGIVNIEQGKLIYYGNILICLNGDTKHKFIGKRKRYLSTGLFKEPDRYMYSVSNGCLYGLLGLCYDAEKRAFIDESAKEWTIDLEYSSYTSVVNYPAKEYLSGITLSCLSNGADGGFYHFLIEAITKLHYYGEVLKVADNILFNGPVTEWKLKWLSYANIDIDKIKWVNSKSHYACEQLIFTSRLVIDQQISDWCITALKTLFRIGTTNNDKIKEKKIIWITRNGLKDRDLEWENDILAIYPEIEMVDLSALNVAETINILQSASHVIGPHGAGLSNIYLCSAGTKILEICPVSTNFLPCFQRIAMMCKLQHCMMYLDFNDKSNAEFGSGAFAKVFTTFTC